MDIFHQILKTYWGYTSFRPLQEDIIHSIYEGKDTLGLMPTGGGKSITFQVPTMALDGICIVITPLIALMRDQVDNLKKRGIKALAIYSGMSHNEIIKTFDNAILGDYKFLYISPERLATELFKNKLRYMHICLIVVDEAHCISQWGYDFRPSYLNIAEVREQFPQIPILALTATATNEVINDIQANLHFKKNNVFSKSFERKNIVYWVKETDNKLETLIRILQKIEGSSIVYVRSRQKTKELSDELLKHNISSDYFHAGLSNEDKISRQNSWKENKCKVIVSTNAFGMGIDKEDVRSVIHIDLPNSLEEYYQEAGRAGRDENKAYAILLYNKTDSSKLKKRIADGFPQKEFIHKVYESLAYFLQIAEGYGLGSVHDFDIYKFCSIYKYPILPTHSALKILDLADYITYTDESNNQSRIMFISYRDELYKLKFDTDYEKLINTILRLYTGLFANYVNINEGYIATQLNMSRKEIYEMLKFLSKRQIIDYIPHKKTPFIIYNRARVDTKHLHIPKSVFEIRKEKFEKRINSMILYAEQKDICRSKIILSYFDEKESKRCNQCDVCTHQNKEIKVDSHYQEIIEKINILLRTSPLKLNIIIEQLLPIYLEKDILKVIRFQLDNELYCQKNDNLFLNTKNKENYSSFE